MDLEETSKHGGRNEHLIHLNREESRKCNWSLARILIGVAIALLTMLIIILIVRASRPEKPPVWEPRVKYPPLGPYTTDMCK